MVLSTAISEATYGHTNQTDLTMEPKPSRKGPGSLRADRTMALRTSFVGSQPTLRQDEDRAQGLGMDAGKSTPASASIVRRLLIEHSLDGPASHQSGPSLTSSAFPFFPQQGRKTSDLSPQGFRCTLGEGTLFETLSAGGEMFSNSLTIVSHAQPPSIAQHVKSRQLMGVTV